jgi:hypothetical protein
VQAYWTFRTSYQQILVPPGKLKVIYSVITRSVSQSVLRHRVLQKLLLCSVLCLYDSCESMPNQPTLWTPDIIFLEFSSQSSYNFNLRREVSERFYNGHCLLGCQACALIEVHRLSDKYIRSSSKPCMKLVASSKQRGTVLAFYELLGLLFNSEDGGSFYLRYIL